MLMPDYGGRGRGMLWDINFLLFCVNMHIVKRHKESKKVVSILVKTRLFSILQNQ